MMEDPEDYDDPNGMVLLTNRDLKHAAAVLALIAIGKLDDSDMKRVGKAGSKQGDAKKLQEMMLKNMAEIMKNVSLKRAEGN
jgi:hypothetical protein